MCFSAPASFGASAVLGIIAYATLRETKHKKDYVLASFPLIFAVQQFIEGLLWLHFSGYFQGPPPYILGFSFLFCAEFIWPIMAPLGVFLIEDNKARQKFILPFVFCGTLLSIYLLTKITLGTVTASAQEQHIVYKLSNVDVFRYTNYVYLFMVSIPFFISSYKMVIVFGASLLTSYFITDYFAKEAYISVWCFFAALLSTILFFHFWNQNKKPTQN